jgi:carbamoyl-phosphate synthase small subunit
MCGYHEILTDPSYTGQTVVMTYPHIGNYGVDDDWSEVGPQTTAKINQVQTTGLVIRQLYEGPVPAGRLTLDQYLKNNCVPGITDIDTRTLTIHLRDNGSPNCVIVGSENGKTLSDQEKKAVLDYLKAFPSMEGRNLVTEVGVRAEMKRTGQKGKKIALIDCGLKANILRILEKLGCQVTLFPSTAVSKDVLAMEPDGVFFSNGPGDPAVLKDLIALAKDCIGKKPTWGICLGHQIISLALGAKTYKMKFGHHGVNHPVRDELTKKVFVTSQNHGFAVDGKTLPEDVTVWFTNANDSSIEGIVHKTLPVRSVQFHPEAAPGPHDTAWIIESYLKTIS